MNKIFKFLSDALFPAGFTCDICGIETFGNNICPECFKTVTFNNKIVCPLCGRKTVRPEICFECKYKAPLFKKAVSPLVYEDGASVLISKFKNGNAYLKDYFARLITEKLNELPEIDCVVYVPMTKNAVTSRGYNQSELLAKCVSQQTELPLIENALSKQKDTAEQKSLSRKEREQNLQKCFKVEKRAEIKGKNVLLIDDILTTGATADAVCSKLLGAGATRVFLATVASVQYKLEKNNEN